MYYVLCNVQASSLLINRLNSLVYRLMESGISGLTSYNICTKNIFKDDKRNKNLHNIKDNELKVKSKR